MSDYIPRTDAGALQWMTNMANKATATPSVWALSAADAAAISGAVSAFQDAYALMGEGRVVIEEALLWVCHVDLGPEIYTDIAKKAA